MSWEQFLSYAFQGLISGAAVLVVTTMRSMKDSIEKLNVKIAVIIERTESHDRRIAKLEDQHKEK